MVRDVVRDVVRDRVFKANFYDPIPESYHGYQQLKLLTESPSLAWLRASPGRGYQVGYHTGVKGGQFEGGQFTLTLKGGGRAEHPRVPEGAARGPDRLFGAELLQLAGARV